LGATLSRRLELIVSAVAQLVHSNSAARACTTTGWPRSCRRQHEQSDRPTSGRP